MTTFCSLCHWLRRLFCVVACREMCAILDAIDRELKREGK